MADSPRHESPRPDRPRLAPRVRRAPHRERDAPHARRRAHGHRHLPPVPVTLTLYPTSNLFMPGHRIRLDVSSSNFPRFDVNPNTGEAIGRERRRVVADNTVFQERGAGVAGGAAGCSGRGDVSVATSCSVPRAHPGNGPYRDGLGFSPRFDADQVQPRRYFLVASTFQNVPSFRIHHIVEVGHPLGPYMIDR